MTQVYKKGTPFVVDLHSSDYHEGDVYVLARIMEKWHPERTFPTIDVYWMIHDKARKEGLNGVTGIFFKNEDIEVVPVSTASLLFPIEDGEFVEEDFMEQFLFIPTDKEKQIRMRAEKAFAERGHIQTETRRKEPEYLPVDADEALYDFAVEAILAKKKMKPSKDGPVCSHFLLKWRRYSNPTWKSVYDLSPSLQLWCKAQDWQARNLRYLASQPPERHDFLKNRLDLNYFTYNTPTTYRKKKKKKTTKTTKKKSSSYNLRKRAKCRKSNNKSNRSHNSHSTPKKHTTPTKRKRTNTSATKKTPPRRNNGTSTTPTKRRRTDGQGRETTTQAESASSEMMAELQHLIIPRQNKDRFPTPSSERRRLLQSTLLELWGQPPVNRSRHPSADSFIDLMDDDIPIDLDESSYTDLNGMPAEVSIEDVSPSSMESLSSSSSSCEMIASPSVATPINQTVPNNPSLQHIKVMYVGEVVTITAWQGTIDSLLEMVLKELRLVRNGSWVLCNAQGKDIPPEQIVTDELLEGNGHLFFLSKQTRQASVDSRMYSCNTYAPVIVAQ